MKAYPFVLLIVGEGLMDVWEWKKEGGWLCIKEANSISSHLNGDAKKKNMEGSIDWGFAHFVQRALESGPKSCLFKSLFETITVAKLWTLKFDLQNYSFLKVFMKQTSRHLDSEARGGLSVEKRVWIQMSSDKKKKKKKAVFNRHTCLWACWKHIGTEIYTQK